MKPVCMLIAHLPFGTALCAGEDPQGLQFEQKFMHSHLLSCLADGEIKPFPCKKERRRRKTKKTCKIAYTAHVELWKEGTWWHVDLCERWFHQDCAKVPHHIWMNADTPWFCDSCSK